MNKNIPPLNHEWACSQCPEVGKAHEHANDMAEYGENWYEFINTRTEVYPMLDRWWNTLSKEKQIEIINNQIAAWRDSIAVMEQIKEEINNE